MIKINFKEPDTPLWKRWRSDREKEATKLKGTRWWESAFEISDLYRRSSIKREVYLAKDGPFRGRCAYCEANVADFQHGDIEHFRPKKLVTDAQDNPIMISGPDGHQHKHPGYYWLAYETSNLLLSCVACNQAGEHGIGKRNRFPTLNGHHAVPEDDVSAEQPSLINPLDPKDDDPESHFAVDHETGMLGYRSSARGAACIDIFGLNKRDQLVTERKSALGEVKAKLIEILYAGTLAAQKATDELKAMEAGSNSHTLARRSQLKELKGRLNW
jgi:hypothetical protein